MQAMPLLLQGEGERLGIKCSTKLNVSQLKLLQEEDDLVHTMKDAAEKQVAEGWGLRTLGGTAQIPGSARCRTMQLPLLDDLGNTWTKRY
ncbi:uncharacterized protein [Physcomitrium patens]|uniref:uncharacterized protein isoform X2 n=1 Tax=Physcomitrium patens TaxID=3218 RepID=UPI003CCCEC6B